MSDTSRKPYFSLYRSLLFLIFLCPTYVLAQLNPIQTKALSTEDKIDQVFGTIVGHMASFLLKDVIFWDDHEAATLQNTVAIQGQTLLQDPLGWHLFIQDKNKVDMYDFAGVKQQSYQTSTAANLASSQLNAKGTALYLIPRQSETAYKVHRSTRAETKLTVKDDVLTGVHQLKDDQGVHDILSSQKGHLWLDEGSTGSLKKLASFTQNITYVTQRSDAQYWLAIDVEGNASVMESATDAEGNKQILGSKKLFTLTVKGTTKKAAITDQYIWIASTQELAVWDSKTGKQKFSIQVPGLQSVDMVDQYFLVLDQQGHIQLLALNGGEKEFILDAALKNENLKSLSIEQGQAWILDSQNTLHAFQIDLKSNPVKFSHQSISRANVTQSHWVSSKQVIINQKGQLEIWQQNNLALPFIVLWLVFGACFFTIRMRFVNFRLFKHAIEVVSGKFSDPKAIGEVSHFQALTSALSATVGLGNIAGVAIAVSLGGAGATFWMILAGLLGMASKFTECTLGQKYRLINDQGEVMGGAMHYLSRGLKTEFNRPILGKILAILFAILCVGGSFGGGNAFQVKQSLGALSEVIPVLADYQWAYGVIMMILVGIVILGGIKRIATTAEKVVPVMCGIYVLAALYIIVSNLSLVPAAIMSIIQGAFAPQALYGGFIGVLVVGFQRAAFSNEAGIGSAAIAHAAAKTEYPVREGVVALLEPFIDTVVVCTMTALVIVITGAYQNPEYGMLITSKAGAALTSQAMGEEISFFPYILAVAVVLFAYSTMISWSYYGERCWSWMFGEKAALISLGKHASLIYRILFLCFVFLGSIINASNILDFSDLMILGMALPNILGLLFLSKGVRTDLDQYETLLNNNEFPIYTQPIEDTANASVEETHEDS